MTPVGSAKPASTYSLGFARYCDGTPIEDLFHSARPGGEARSRSAVPPPMVKIVVATRHGSKNYIASFMQDFYELLRGRGWRLLFDDHFDEKIVKRADVVAFYGIFAAVSDRYSEPARSGLLATWHARIPAGARRVFIIEDVHKPFDVSEARFAAHHFDYVLARYPEATEKAVGGWQDKRARCIHFPHAATDRFFRLPPDSVDPRRRIPKILLSGRMVQSVYPSRYAAFEVMNRGFTGIALRHHGGWGDIGDAYREAIDYSHEINRYLIAFAGANRGGGQFFDEYVLAKTFEIPASDTVLMTDAFLEDKLRPLGFVKNEHYVTADEQSMEADFRLWLSDEMREQVHRVRANAFALVHELHRNAHRANLLDALSSQGCS